MGMNHASLIIVLLNNDACKHTKHSINTCRMNECSKSLVIWRILLHPGFTFIPHYQLLNPQAQFSQLTPCLSSSDFPCTTQLRSFLLHETGFQLLYLLPTSPLQCVHHIPPRLYLVSCPSLISAFLGLTTDVFLYHLCYPTPATIVDSHHNPKVEETMKQRHGEEFLSKVMNSQELEQKSELNSA